MRAVLERLHSDLTWFVEQSDNLALVLSCTEIEVPYVAKVLERVEVERDADLFLVFPQPVERTDDAGTYATRLLANVEAQRRGVNEIRDAEGLPPWPELPRACHDPNLAADVRLRTMLQWLREQVPDRRNRIVFGLIPVTIGNPAAYASAVRGFLPANELEPWTAGLRFLLRDDRRAPMLIPHLDEHATRWVIAHEGLDLSPAALTQSLVHQLGDRAARDEDRMVALVQLAAMDFAHRRYAASIRKWGAAFGHYQRAQVPQMQALCLCGAADVLRATGRLPEAKQTYQQGLAYTKAAEHFPVMLNLLVGVGEACVALQHWEEAEGYLDLAQQIADATRLLHPRCDIMQRRGLALLALGRTTEAFTTWRACADVSAALGYRERRLEALRGLVQLGRNSGADVRGLEAELAEASR